MSRLFGGGRRPGGIGLSPEALGVRFGRRGRHSGMDVCRWLLPLALRLVLELGARLAIVLQVLVLELGLGLALRLKLGLRLVLRGRSRC